LKKLMLLVSMLAMVLLAAAPAFAQPVEAQYGAPTATPGGNPAMSGNTPSGGPAGGGGASAGVLPATGGPLLPLAALGALALGATSVLVRWQAGRQ
jgi:hypothetical protein